MDFVSVFLARADFRYARPPSGSGELRPRQRALGGKLGGKTTPREGPRLACVDPPERGSVMVRKRPKLPMDAGVSA